MLLLVATAAVAAVGLGIRRLNKHRFGGGYYKDTHYGED